MLGPRKIAILGGGGGITDEKAVAFDGTLDKIRIPHHANLINEPFSISVWFKGYTDITIRGIYSKVDTVDTDNRTGYSATITSAPVIEHRVADGSNLLNSGSSSNVIENTWHHIVQVFDKTNTDMMTYFNGVLEQTDASVADMDSSNAVDLYLGSYYSTNLTDYLLIGEIGDVAYYNSVLSPSEVSTIYNGREPYNHKEGIASGNLVSWWRMGDDPNDEVGTSVTLISDSSNPGLGPELIGDPSFDNASYWTIGTNWAVSGGKATASSATNSQGVSKANILTNDADAQRTYRLEYTISDYTDGSVRGWIGTSTTAYRTSAGTYVEFIKCGGSAHFQFAGKDEGDVFQGSISDVSVKEVLGNPGYSTGDPLIVSKGSY